MLLIELVLPVTSAQAQRARISLVRDAEIEALIKEIARPLMKAAGLRRGSVDYRIVNNSSFNAFVSGRGMFVNTGLLLQAEDPSEVIGVVAHELGHVIGGHQIRLRERIETATRISQVDLTAGSCHRCGGCCYRAVASRVGRFWPRRQRQHIRAARYPEISTFRRIRRRPDSR